MTERPVVVRAGVTRRLLERLPERLVPALNVLAFAAIGAALVALLLI